MKNYKKILSIAMLFMLALCVGCNKDETENNDEYEYDEYEDGGRMDWAAKQEMGLVPTDTPTPTLKPISDMSRSKTEYEWEYGDFKYVYLDEGKYVEITEWTGGNRRAKVPSEIDGKPVISIGIRAFSDSYMPTVEIPDTVRAIGEYAFEDCDEIEEVTLPEGITDIPRGAFSGCYELRTVYIPSTVTKIGDYAFHDCTHLSSITIPEGVTAIGMEAFTGVENMKELIIPESVTDIYNGAIEARAFWMHEGKVKVKSGSYAEEWVIENNIPYETNGFNVQITPSPAAACYRAGKYSSVLTINDSAMTLEVLVDTDRVKAVRLYMDESTAAMYPLFIPAANDIGEQLAAGTAFDDLELNESSRHTQTLLIGEIKKTLEKALLSRDSSDSGEE